MGSFTSEKLVGGTDNDAVRRSANLFGTAKALNNRGRKICTHWLDGNLASQWELKKRRSSVMVSRLQKNDAIGKYLIHEPIGTIDAA